MNKFWTIKNEAGSETVEMLIYGQISSEPWYDDEVGPKQFADDLKDCGGKDILLRINSPGGDVFAAQAIYNILKSYKGNVTAHIDGMCASAATLIACGAHTVIMPRNALYMIHNPKAMVFDNMDAKALKKMADTMDKVKDTIVSAYATKVGDKMTTDEITSLMDDETWMNAEEALAKGLVDEIDDYEVQAEMKSGLMVVNSISMPFKDKELLKIKHVMHEKKGPQMDNSNEIISKIKAVLGMKPENKVQEKLEDTKAAEERQRLSDLDALQPKNKNPYVEAAIGAFKSMPGMTAQLAHPVIGALLNVKEEPTMDERLQAIANIINDNMDSGASGVKAQPQAKEPDANQVKNQATADIVARINKIREGK